MRYLRAPLAGPLVFQSAGQFHSSRAWKHTRRVIDSYEIVIGVRGTLHIQQSDEPHAIGPGDVLVLVPGEEHFGHLPCEPGVSFYWIHFLCPNGSDLRHEREPEGGPDPSLTLPLRFRPADGKRVEILFHQLQHLANSAIRYPQAPHFALTSLLLELAEQAFTAEEAGTAAESEPLVAEISEWIRVHATQPITVASIAERYGYNRDYLTRVFKRTFGMSLQEYIQSQKLNLAKAMLTGSNRTVKQIAREIGMADEKYFVRLFRKYERLTPTEYRNAYYRKHLNIR